MGYQVKIKNLAEREAKIRASSQASSLTRDFYDFRTQKYQLKEIRIPNDLLLYRMENFRTYIEQNAFITREKKTADYFLSGQENEGQQQIQHDILAKLAATGIADSVVPIQSVLESEGQREPILITHRGIVVNGNRRLAAMREILADDVTRTDFDNINCLVLPEDTTPDEIIEIEADLQARPETKLDYNWIADCLLIQKLNRMGHKVPEIGVRLKRKPAEIKNSLAALSEATLYLSDWVKAPGDYTKVLDAEQFFKDLPSMINDKEPALAEASRVIAWNLLENKGQLGERLYAFNSAIKNHAPEILDGMSSELGIPLSTNNEEDSDEEFEVDVSTAEQTASYEPIVAAFRDPERKAEAIETMIEISKNIIEQNRGKKTGEAALKAIASANTRLMEVDLGRADIATLPVIERQLEQILKKAGELKTTAANIIASQKKRA